MTACQNGQVKECLSNSCAKTAAARRTGEKEMHNNNGHIFKTKPGGRGRRNIWCTENTSLSIYTKLWDLNIYVVACASAAQNKISQKLLAVSGNLQKHDISRSSEQSRRVSAAALMWKLHLCILCKSEKRWIKDYYKWNEL